MALTYRSVKGSALTIEQLDNNFRHFTGSHSITGSLNITGSLIITGSITGSSFSGSVSGSIDGRVLFINDLPTADPASAGQIYNDCGTIKVSAG